jgi:uncharacterized membrane protein
MSGPDVARRAGTRGLDVAMSATRRGRVAVALLSAALLATGAQAEPAPLGAPTVAAAAEAPPPDLVHLARKTATYQAMSSFNDFVYGAVFAGGIAAGGVLAAASLVTEPIVHFLHEAAWNTAPAVDRDEALRRVPVKAATYTMANSGRVFASAWLLTGNPVVAAGMVAFNAVGDAVVYAVNDAAWARFGPEPEAAPAAAPAAGDP